MAISILAQRNAMATAYGVAAPNGSMFTSTGPGTTGSATNECTGGAPAFARKALSWGAAAASAVVSALTPFDIASATTVTFFGVTVSAVLTTADVRDALAVTNQTFASQGVYSVTATYTQS
jgi:hypothetical protein